MFKKIGFLAVLLVAVMSAFAQMGGGMSSGRFYGKIVDSKSGKGIEAASVQLISSKINPATGQKKDTIINGMLTRANGDFELESVPFMGSYKLYVTAMGFKEYEEKVSFLTPEIQKSLTEAIAKGSNPMEAFKKAVGGDFSKIAAMADKDLGNIKLEADASVLENVTVTATKSMQLAVDRKIFNVEKNLAASGGLAVDVLRQIPSLNVDIDGNVTVRNSTPTLFIDGRPTTLTIEQIPADAIQSVELITNPSAKYDASGGAASILNIILKKNRKSGYNGNLRAGIDSRWRPNFGGDINYRQGKLNFFASGMYGQRKSISESDIDTRYNATENSPTTFITQDVDGTNKGSFRFIRGGMDYFMNNRTSFTVGGNYMKGNFGNDEDNRQRYDSMYSPAKVEFGTRKTVSDGYFQNVGGSLGMKHNFAKTGHEITADVNYSQNKSEMNADYRNRRTDESGTPLYNDILQRTFGGSKSTYIVAQTDYANPITDKIKLEFGLRAQVRDFESNNYNAFYNYVTQKYEENASISSDYKFKDEVYAAYGTLTGKAGNLGYNVGLRAESSNYTGTLVRTNESIKVEYPIQLFPSAFLSYKVGDRSDVQFNYSRRVNRPNFFQLMPFINYDDPLNLRIGNAGLTPEFTNSFEANYSHQFNNFHNILLSGYYKRTNNLITNYQYKGLNPASGDSAIYNSYINADNSTRYGAEFTVRNQFTPKFDITTNLNVYHANITSINSQGESIDNGRWSFFGKMTITQRLGKNNEWTLQANGDYQGKTVVPVNTGGGMFRGPMGGGIQPAGSNGYVNPNYGLDLSVKRDIIKNKGGQGYQASVTLSVNDVFRTRIYDIVTSSDFFYQTLQRRRDPQVFRLQFNWRFGKVDATLFKRKNVKSGMDGMQDGMSNQQ
ncbi:TonB-dependent receptor domain-containing protein [Polluticaenibacter yanchengensis]|uniref:TonB dependent receptor n=1 Tax=Polluticaenibacter yanchengensis TaxID=3014562 RepID=A0ABT4UIU7_9BACT|nr:TonB dependent receptor [Chitinophagaceae bacterium LY-5]